jgi:hypothetical protein
MNYAAEKKAIRADAVAYLRSRPTELVWVPCTFCGEDSLVSMSVFVVEMAARGECVLGDVCEGCQEQNHV